MVLPHSTWVDTGGDDDNNNSNNNNNDDDGGDDDDDWKCGATSGLDGTCFIWLINRNMTETSPSLHFIPIGDNAIVDGVVQFQRAASFLCFISNIAWLAGASPYPTVTGMVNDC